MLHPMLNGLSQIYTPIFSSDFQVISKQNLSAIKSYRKISVKSVKLFADFCPIFPWTFNILFRSIGVCKAGVTLFKTRHF